MDQTLIKRHRRSIEDVVRRGMTSAALIADGGPDKTCSRIKKSLAMAHHDVATVVVPPQKDGTYIVVSSRFQGEAVETKILIDGART